MSSAFPQFPLTQSLLFCINKITLYFSSCHILVYNVKEHGNWWNFLTSIYKSLRTKNIYSRRKNNITCCVYIQYKKKVYNKTCFSDSHDMRNAHHSRFCVFTFPHTMTQLKYFRFSSFNVFILHSCCLEKIKLPSRYICFISFISLLYIFHFKYFISFYCRLRVGGIFFFGLYLRSSNNLLQNSTVILILWKKISLSLLSYWSCQQQFSLL